MVSVIEFPVCLLVLVKVSNNLFFLQYKVAEVRVVVLLGMVVRRKSRASCWWPNIFCPKLINSGWILMFYVSMVPH